MTVPVGTKKKFGPYKGSESNGGRPLYVWRTKMANGNWKTNSASKARTDYEEAHHETLSSKVDVDHKDSNHNHDSLSNLQVMSKHDNVAKENIRRGKAN